VLVDCPASISSTKSLVARAGNDTCLVPSGMLVAARRLEHAPQLVCPALFRGRKKEILPHLAAARTNQAIAARMTISENDGSKALVRSVRVEARPPQTAPRRRFFAVSQNFIDAADHR